MPNTLSVKQTSQKGVPRFAIYKGSLTAEQASKILANTKMKKKTKEMMLEYLVAGESYNSIAIAYSVSRQFLYRKLLSIESRLMRQSVLHR